MNLKSMEQQIQVVLGLECSFIDLFSETFIVANTTFTQLDEFKNVLPFDLNNFENVSESELNQFVKMHTSCNSWQQFITSAMMYFKNM